MTDFDGVFVVRVSWISLDGVTLIGHLVVLWSSVLIQYYHSTTLWTSTLRLHRRLTIDVLAFVEFGLFVVYTCLVFLLFSTYVHGIYKLLILKDTVKLYLVSKL